MLILLILLYSLSGVVRNENVKILKTIGIQYSVNYFLGGKKSLFIPYSNIHKIVINEVICFVSIIKHLYNFKVQHTPFFKKQNRIVFVLQLLMDKEFYKEMPIVVLFNVNILFI